MIVRAFFVIGGSSCLVASLESAVASILPAPGKPRQTCDDQVERRSTVILAVPKHVSCAT